MSSTAIRSATSISPAMEEISVRRSSPNLSHTLDYRCVSNIVAREMAIPSDLIEHVAWRIKHALQLSFPQATDIRVAVAKKNPPLSLQVAWAEVEI